MGGCWRELGMGSICVAVPSCVSARVSDPDLFGRIWGFFSQDPVFVIFISRIRISDSDPNGSGLLDPDFFVRTNRTRIQNTDPDPTFEN